MSGAGKVVCVTGASGYIASWLVKLLLQHGYTVKASVRDPNDSKKTGDLLSLDGAKERLHLLKANLLEEGSFDAVFEGCEGVFHTASPVLLSYSDPKAEIIDPALKGTLNVLRSCAKVRSLKRVIITSSVAAAMYNGKSLNPDVVVDETCFSDPVYCEEMKLWYPLSKILAENAAWEFTKEKGIDLVTLLPTYVIGPVLTQTLGATVEVFLNKINGGQVYPNRGFVDVRDVAKAHVEAFEVDLARGRYCLVGDNLHMYEALKILRELYPNFNLPEGNCEDDNPLIPKCQVSNEKATSLGINFIPLEVSLRDTVESLKEKGFLNF